MYFTWVQNQSSDKKWRDLGVFLDIFPQKQNFVGSFQNYIGRKRNFVRLNLKNVPRNRTNDVLFYKKRHVVSSQTSRRFL